MFFEIKSKSNPFLFCSSVFLSLQGQPDLCGSYHLLQSCFLSSSVSMANLSRLVDALFSSFALLSSSVSMANLNSLLATTFSSLRFLSNSFSSPRFNLLRVAKRCFSWSSVSDDFSFPLVIFLFPFLLYIFPRLILSLFLLCSSVSEALFALSFSFLGECFPPSFFVHAKAALAFSRNE